MTKVTKTTKIEMEPTSLGIPGMVPFFCQHEGEDCAYLHAPTVNDGKALFGLSLQGLSNFRDAVDQTIDLIKQQQQEPTYLSVEFEAGEAKEGRAHITIGDQVIDVVPGSVKLSTTTPSDISLDLEGCRAFDNSTVRNPVEDVLEMMQKTNIEIDDVPPELFAFLDKGEFHKGGVVSYNGPFGPFSLPCHFRPAWLGLDTGFPLMRPRPEQLIMLDKEQLLQPVKLVNILEEYRPTPAIERWLNRVRPRRKAQIGDVVRIKSLPANMLWKVDEIFHDEHDMEDETALSLVPCNEQGDEILCDVEGITCLISGIEFVNEAPSNEPVRMMPNVGDTVSHEDYPDCTWMVQSIWRSWGKNPRFDLIRDLYPTESEEIRTNMQVDGWAKLTVISPTPERPKAVNEVGARVTHASHPGYVFEVSHVSDPLNPNARVRLDTVEVPEGEGASHVTWVAQNGFDGIFPADYPG